MHGQFPACQDRAQLISIWKESARVENVHFHLREEKRLGKCQNEFESKATYDLARVTSIKSQ